ncbi:MAG TPA: DinB family protein [Symbiobacteriaceae bacterium]
MQSGFVAGIMAALDFGQNRIKEAIRDLSPEQLAAVPDGFQNSIATLVVHLAATEVNFAYRFRGEPVPDALRAEFLLDKPHDPLPAPEGETAESLIAKLDKARSVLTEAAERLTDADLDREWEGPGGRRMSVRLMLSILPYHQGLHFGHIQYLKRMIG